MATAPPSPGRSGLFALALFALSPLGCRQSVPLPGPDVFLPRPNPVGRPCQSQLDCPLNYVCAGPSGCDAEWQCEFGGVDQAQERVYCGCDGHTFWSGTHWPSQKYQSIGKCPAPP